MRRKRKSTQDLINEESNHDIGRREHAQALAKAKIDIQIFRGSSKKIQQLKGHFQEKLEGIMLDGGSATAWEYQLFSVCLLFFIFLPIKHPPHVYIYKKMSGQEYSYWSVDEPSDNNWVEPLENSRRETNMNRNVRIVRIIYNCGTIYDGEINDYKKEGFGVLKFPDGATYTGEFKDDKQNGNGVMKDIIGYSYVGEWKDNKFDGYGIYTCKDKYEGGFKNGLIHGHGSVLFENGCKYIGEWRFGRAEGVGILEFPDGVIYNGKFNNHQVACQGEWYYFETKLCKSVGFKNRKNKGRGIEIDQGFQKLCLYYFDGTKKPN